MAPSSIVRALAVVRIGIGAVLLLAPRRAAASWIGFGAYAPGVPVIGRALGARDALMGGMLLHTARHPQVGRRWTATCGAIDLVDGGALLAERRDVPAANAIGGLAVAFGSALVHFALARALTSPSGLEDAAARSTPAPASSPETVMPDGAEEAKRAMGARTIGVDPPR
jgi:hypothetical protein